MATFTITTGTPASPVNIDTLTGKTGGDTYNITGGTLLIDQDSRYGLEQNTSAILGAVTGSASSGGNLIIDGTLVRLIPYDNGSGNVPASGTTISGASGSGKLIGVYSALNVAPTTAGSAMPAAGYIKIKQWNESAFVENEALSGIGADVDADPTFGGTDRAGWIEVVAQEGSNLSMRRLLNQSQDMITGAWYLVGTTGGSRTDTYQIPYQGANLYIPGVQVVNSDTSASISNMSWTDGLMTVTATSHGFVEGDAVDITGVTPNEYNFTNKVIQYVDANTFTFYMPIEPSASYSSGGTVTGRDEWFGAVKASATSAMVETNGTKGKVCWVSTNGTLRFGHDGTNSSGGWLPPAGRTIRMGNVILQNATSAAKTQNSLNISPTSRFRLLPYTARIYIKKATIAWSFGTLTVSPYALNFQDTSFTQTVYISNCATKINILRCCVAPTTPGDQNSNNQHPLFVSTSDKGANITDTTAIKDYTQTNEPLYTFSATSSNNFAITNCVFGLVGTTDTSNSYAVYANLANNITIDDTILGGFLYITQTSAIEYKRNVYYTSNGTLFDFSSSGDFITITNKSSDILIDGMSTNGSTVPIGGKGEFVKITSTASDIKIRNAGNFNDPLVCGDTIYEDAAWTRSGSTITVTETSHPYRVNDYLYPVRTSSSTATGTSLEVCTAVTANTWSFAGAASGDTSGTITYNRSFVRTIATIQTACSNIEFNNVHLTKNAGVLSTDATDTNILLENVSTDHYATYSTALSANDLVGRSFQSYNFITAATTGQYGQSFMDVFCQRLDTPNTGTSTYTRTTTAYEITKADHKLLPATYVYIHDCDNTGLPNDWEYISTASSTKDKFIVTGTNTGAASGTVSWKSPHSRLILYMNEESESTTRYTIDSGTPAFTGDGTVSMQTTGDQITWETPEYLLGHDSFAIVPLNSNISYAQMEYYDQTYAIDTGSGTYSSFKNLNYPRTGASGTASATTITMTDTTGVAVGDYVFGEFVGYGAKVVSVDSGTQITVDVANAQTFSSKTIFFNHAPNETLTADGFKLKWRIKANQDGGAAFRAMELFLNDTATSRARLYPIVGETVNIAVTGIASGYRIQVYNVTQATEIANTTTTGSTYTYVVTNEANDGDVIRVRLAKTGKLPIQQSGVFSSTAGLSILAEPEDDTVYTSYGVDGSAVTEYAWDNANSEIEINEASTYSAKEMYAWYQYFLTTSTGIDQAFGVMEAIDAANIQFTGIKLDNVNAATIAPTDNIRIFRTDDALPVINPTTGGGGISLFGTGYIYTNNINTATNVITGDIADVPSVSEIADGVWDEALSGHTTSGTAGQVLSDTEDIPFQKT